MESPYPYHPRNKRAVDEEMEKELSCGPTECIKIRCRINQLASGSSVLFMLEKQSV